MPSFEQSVFINCPFDKDYAPLLQAVAFCVVCLGFTPRLAPENSDNAIARLDRIVGIIETSQFGIHDLSRCKSSIGGEFARMNMPFELGMDYAAKRFGGPRQGNKAILVLETNRYDYQKSLSDISGWDIEAHGGDYYEAIRAVRGWLIRQAGAPDIRPAAIKSKYAAFQEWYYERELAAGASKADILRYPTIDLIDAMVLWMEAGQPH